MHVPFFQEALALLQSLIATPSLSREEDQTAALIAHFLTLHGAHPHRHLNNVWAVATTFDPAKPTLLLNSHHDTVKPNPGYTRDPFLPQIKGGKLYGLGSNDAGGCAVSLMAAFLHLQHRTDLAVNLVLAITAEEEISGENGLGCLLPLLPPIDMAIVGEPTQTQVAVAEKGLMVLDGLATGRAGHAARNEGENALYKALADIQALTNHRFERESAWLGPVKVTITSIETPNKQHNVVPDRCQYVVDVRVTDVYTHEEVLATLQSLVSGTLVPRSMRLRSSGIAQNHPLVQAALNLGKTLYGSPTSSDQALLSVPSIKMGPGDSARSHTADEYIFVQEIADGISSYLAVIEGLER